METSTKKSISDFKNTDPDNFQYGRKVREGVYEFREFDRQNFVETFKGLKKMSYENSSRQIKANFNSSEFWVELTIMMAHYSESEIENHISAYHKNLAELKEIYGDDWEFIVAEIIFEQESLLY